MSCASCALSVEKALRAQKGMARADVNYANASATIEYDDNALDLTRVQQAVRAAGYDVVLPDSGTTAGEQKEQYYRTLRRQAIVALACAVPLMYIGMFAMHEPWANYAMWALATPVVFYPGARFFTGAWQQLRHRTASMDTLVALSTGIAYVFSVFNTLFPQRWAGMNSHVYFEASAVVIAFVLLGKLLEERAKHSTSAAIRKLAELQPQTVQRLTAGGSQETVSLDAVQPGDSLIARPGERIAVDGQVSDGSSWIDESMLTGESVAVEKTAGAKVFAGTINQKGSLTYTATKVGTDTMLAHIIRMVQEAQGSKAPVQHLADKIAAVFVPSVLGIATLTFIIWLVAGGEQGLAHGFEAFVTVLVIACPCALGLATPTALIAGIGRGAGQGILIRDAQNLERACTLNAIALDKTGTITEGRPEVAHLQWATGTDAALLTSVLYSMEQLSEHPLAAALSDHLAAQGAAQVAIHSFGAIPGGGISGFHGSNMYFAGSEKLLQSMNITIPDELRTIADSYASKAHTIIWLADFTKALGMAALADKVKPTSVQAVAALQQMGIEVYMLTGDNEHTAAEIVAQTGIRHYEAGLSPTDKMNRIKALQDQGKVTAMVGDGINDGQALAQADVSIAMGRGTDIARDVAGITILSSELSQIPAAIKLSEHTMRVIRQNLFWAFIYNVIGIPIAAGVLYPINGFMLNPMIAGAAMALSSVSVVTNSLRLRWQKF